MKKSKLAIYILLGATVAIASGCQKAESSPEKTTNQETMAPSTKDAMNMNENTTQPAPANKGHDNSQKPSQQMNMPNGNMPNGGPRSKVPTCNGRPLSELLESENIEEII